MANSSEEADSILEEARSDRAIVVENDRLKAENRALHSALDQLEERLEVRASLRKRISTPPIPKVRRSGKGADVIPIILQSDEHYDEEFTLGQTNGLNEQNAEIAEAKVETFVQRARRLTEREMLDNPVPRIVSPLLGDMITGELHDKDERASPLTPHEAARFAYRLKRRIFDDMLRWDVEEIWVPCVDGNHGRSTAKRTPGLNRRYSFENDVYLRLADHYDDEPRIRFYVPETDWVSLKVWDDGQQSFTMVMSHGDSVRGGGGIGGLAPPLLRALSRWRRGTPGDFYAIGHFHQYWDLGELVVNPNANGYNPYAASGNMDPGPFPGGAQLFTTLHTGRMQRGTTCPIWLR